MITFIDDHFYRIQVPIPFPMKYVYCYLFKDDMGWTIVDAGYHDQTGEQIWNSVFSELSIHPTEVKRIYLTHFHPDHFGLAGWLQQLTGAPVYMHEKDIRMVDKVWGPGSVQAKKVGLLCLQNGTPEKLAQGIEEHMLAIDAFVMPLPRLEQLKEQEVVLGSRPWKIIHTPGHSDGQVCFYQPEKKWLLAADHILDKITPNISIWPEASLNPLQDYIVSLRELSKMEISTAFPAHGKVINDIQGRIRQILSHHEERLGMMCSIAADGRSAYQVAEEVFGVRELTPHQWRFALTETLAHLEHLVADKQLGKNHTDTIRYGLQV